MRITIGRLLPVKENPAGVTTPRGVPAVTRVGLGRVELPTSRLSGVRSNHLSYRPSYLPSRRPRVEQLVPLPPRPLLRLELVVLVIIELVVEVVVVVEVFAVLVVQVVLVQLVVEVFVQVLILFEFLELFVDVVAATLERPLHRRCHGQHRHPQQRLELMETSPTTAPPASRC